MEYKELEKYLTPDEKRKLGKLLSAKIAPTFLDPNFPLQNAFIEDKHLLKALLCTRRAGKSYAAGAYLLRTALGIKNSNCLYIGLTRDSAKRIIWNDILKAQIAAAGVEARYNETELTIRFPATNSTIYILGIDDNENEQTKLLGKRYHIAVIDEAASYVQDLHNLVYKTLKPALADARGTLCLIGTPDDRKSGLFYELTRDVPTIPPTRTTRQGWSIHTWTAWDNPYVSANWQETIADLEKHDPHVREQSWFRQHYLGEWVIDDSAKVYRYSGERNGWNGVLPQYGDRPYHYTLGIDLGFADATALVLLAYHDFDPHVYILRAQKRTGLTITDVAGWIREWQYEFPIEAFVVDGANRQAVEEIVRHHGLPLVAAEKTDKVSFIRIMNSDMISGKIKIDTRAADCLIAEYDQLVWDRRALEKGIYKEGAFHGDAVDAALYGYRFCYHYASTSASPAHVAQIEREEWYREQARIQAEREQLYAGSEYLFLP